MKALAAVEKAAPFPGREQLAAAHRVRREAEATLERAKGSVEKARSAIDDAEAFLKADPKSAERSDALYVLGLAQEGAQKFGDAAKSFQALLEADPKYSAADKR